MFSAEVKMVESDQDVQAPKPGKFESMKALTWKFKTNLVWIRLRMKGLISLLLEDTG